MTPQQAELLTAHRPFAGPTLGELLRRVVEEEPVPPRLLRRELPRDLETICLTCLQKDPARRYGSAEALADDLDRWCRSEPIEARRPGRLRPHHGVHGPTRFRPSPRSMIACVGRPD